MMCRSSQNVTDKPPFGTMCLQDNLVDCAASGGLLVSEEAFAPIDSILDKFFIFKVEIEKRD